MENLKVILKATPDGPEYNLNELESLPDHLYVLGIVNVKTGEISETIPHPKKIITKGISEIKDTISKVCREEEKYEKTQRENLELGRRSRRDIPTFIIATSRYSLEGYAKMRIEEILSKHSG